MVDRDIYHRIINILHHIYKKRTTSHGFISGTSSSGHYKLAPGTYITYESGLCDINHVGEAYAPKAPESYKPKPASTSYEHTPETYQPAPASYESVPEPYYATKNTYETAPVQQ